MEKLTMPDKNMKISLIQFDPVWEEAGFSLARLSAFMQSLEESRPDIVLLPEMFATGFSMNVERITAAADLTLLWMKTQARLVNTLVVGSMAVSEGGRYFNRMYWVKPDGSYDFYDKHHLLRISDEPQVYTAGCERKTFTWRGWKLCPIVCYDLRFPEWFRNSADEPYDMLLCCASWPTVRIDVWKTLLKARAIENQCYVAGVNRVHDDGLGYAHSGESLIINPKGTTIVAGMIDREDTLLANLSLEDLHTFRNKFPVLEDGDKFELV